MDPKKRPATKTMEPPARKESQQVPAEDETDINENRKTGEAEGQPHNGPDQKRRENKPIEKESDKGENTGCAC